MYGTISYAGVAYAGDPFHAAVTRVAVEAITSNDHYAQRVSRLVAEAITSNDSQRSVVTRLAVEAIGDAFAGIPPIHSTVTRAVAEVIGSVSPFGNKHLTTSRVAAEVIGSAAVAKRGFSLPSVSVTQASAFVVLKPDAWASGGEFFAQDSAGKGFRARGDATTTTVLWSNGLSSAQGSFPTPSAKTIVSVLTGASPVATQIRVNGAPLSLTAGGPVWPATVLTDLMRQHDPSRQASGQIAELMLFNRTLSNAERDYIEAYLTCKWVTPGCNPNTDLPPAP